MKEYLIKKGNHYASGLHIGVHFGITEQKYKVRFSKECLYTPDWENDWNKLCGWSYGLHHKNSIRVCWRAFIPPGVDYRFYTPAQIELCIYVYEDEVRSNTEKNIVVDADRDFILDLKYSTTGSIISLSTDISPIIVGKCYSTKPSWGYFLFPYIGGDNVAVQDTRIYLEKL